MIFEDIGCCSRSSRRTYRFPPSNSRCRTKSIPPPAAAVPVAQIVSKSFGSNNCNQSNQPTGGSNAKSKVLVLGVRVGDNSSLSKMYTKIHSTCNRLTTARSPAEKKPLG
ncbi:hypothetical protein M407DRAFT_138476 [Tulasnella calospora MUT 4182]|uniref:Uncharacterized protein n=1 Tax=Tulasnella calospora MUT 4182 TaxID=1051891 RepID=A0A0C3Q8X9_9AGAM|nr:hypothetical protein M407DRAFT_138476 [Tulasnella calospora MUT 4182]